MTATTRTFSRFKYAEEHAHDLLKAGHLFSLTIVPDVSHLDSDGETYVYDDFTVTDLGDRTDSPVPDVALVDAIEAKLGPLSGDQILVLRGEFNEDIVENLLGALIDAARERGMVGPAVEHIPLVLALAHGQSIELLDEDVMRAAGWIRADSTP